MTSIGERNGESDYVESAANSPTSPANTPDLEGYISELEKMHKVVESELVELAQPTVIVSCIDELELPDLNDAETEPPVNHQDNGTTTPVNTQTSPPHSPLEETSVAPDASPPRHCVEAGNAVLQV